MLDEHAVRWSVRAGGVSDSGRVRQDNQDRCLVDIERLLFIVSDGIGGHQAGEIAAEAVVTILPSLLEQHMRWKDVSSTEMAEGMLREVILELSRSLRSESQGRVGVHGMGATIALAWLHGVVAYVAHMGDSRIYLFRQKHLVQLTEDHSVTALLLRHGEITPAEAKTHPARGRLSRYIGMEEEVYPDVQTVQVQDRDRFLLCSDGLTNLVSNQQIVQILQANTEPKESCQALVSAANAAGGTDNITALVVNVLGRK